VGVLLLTCCPSPKPATTTTGSWRSSPWT